MRKITAALAGLPLALAFVNPAAATHVSGHGDAVGPVQWVGCADIGQVEITELPATVREDENDPAKYADPLNQFQTEPAGEARDVTGVRVTIDVYKGSCLSQDRLGSAQHAVTFDASLYRKNVDRSSEPATESFSATNQSVDIRSVEQITDPNSEFMLRVTLDFNFENPNDRYTDETDGDGEGTMSNFYYCVQGLSLIHKKASDWAPDLFNGQFDTRNPLCTDGQAGGRTAG